MQPWIDSKLFASPESMRAKLAEFDATVKDDIPLGFDDLHFVREHAMVAGVQDDRLTLRADNKSMIFGVWARSQLLTTVGAREKWFAGVTLETAAEELTRRTPALRNQIAKVRCAADSDVDTRIVRGLVSTSYAALLDRDLFVALEHACPSLVLLRGSTKSETSLYCYAVHPHPLKIPDTEVEVYGGALVRNSEVGYTSLWVSPFHAWIYPTADGRVTRKSVRIAVDEKNSYRRVHRGHPRDLEGDLRKALANTPLLDAPRARLTQTIRALAGITYATEAEALAQGDRILRQCKAPAGVRKAFETAYKKTPHTAHTGFTIYEALLRTTVEPVLVDATYKAFAIAGAVLLHLV